MRPQRRKLNDAQRCLREGKKAFRLLLSSNLSGVDSLYATATKGILLKCLITGIPKHTRSRIYIVHKRPTTNNNNSNRVDTEALFFLRLGHFSRVNIAQLGC